MKNSCKILASNGELFSTKNGTILNLWVEIKDESGGELVAKKRANGSMYFAEGGAAYKANLNYANSLIKQLGGVDSLEEGFDINAWLESKGLPTYGAAIIETLYPQYENHKPFARYTDIARTQIAAIQAGNLSSAKKIEAITKLKTTLGAKGQLLEDIISETGEKIYRQILAVDEADVATLTKRVKQMAREAVTEK